MKKGGRACLVFGLIATIIIFAIACGTVNSQDTLVAGPKDIQAAFSRLDKDVFRSTLQDSEVGIVIKKEWKSGENTYKKVKLTVVLKNSETLTLIPSDNNGEGLRDATELWIVSGIQVGDLITFRDLDSKYSATNPRSGKTLFIYLETARLLISHEDLGLVVRENQHWK